MPGMHLSPAEKIHLLKVRLRSKHEQMAQLLGRAKSVAEAPCFGSKGDFLILLFWEPKSDLLKIQDT